jgi:hypothetical protein
LSSSVSAGAGADGATTTLFGRSDVQENFRLLEGMDNRLGGSDGMNLAQFIETAQSSEVFHFSVPDAAGTHIQFDLPAWTAQHHLTDYHLI